jgi:hypothetical protein
MLPASSLLDTPAASLNDPDWAAAARQALQQATRACTAASTRATTSSACWRARVPPTI